jgi:UDP-glucose:(heptosyl)LPS alpha-1,3-glucosyltransferase
LRLVIGGQDRRSRRWQRAAERRCLGDRVVWLGVVSQPELCYRGADLYVLPTRYDPAANSTLEALASGLPVVTSAMNGAAEIVEPGVHGAVLPTPVHPEELKRALIDWLDRARSKRVCASTRLLAERFPARISCESTLDVYRSVLEDRADRVNVPTASTTAGTTIS